MAETFPAYISSQEKGFERFHKTSIVEPEKPILGYIDQTFSYAHNAVSIRVYVYQAQERAKQDYKNALDSALDIVTPWQDFPVEAHFSNGNSGRVQFRKGNMVVYVSVIEIEFPKVKKPNQNNGQRSQIEASEKQASSRMKSKTSSQNEKPFTNIDLAKRFARHVLNFLENNSQE